MSSLIEPAVRQPALDAAYGCLSDEMRVPPGWLRVAGRQVTTGNPATRPYFLPAEALLAAFEGHDGIAVSVVSGLQSLARTWLDRHDEPLVGEGLRWLAHNVARAESLLEVVEQYVLTSVDHLATPAVPVRRLGPGDYELLEAELGWSARVADDWLRRGLYGAFVGRRLASRVCCYRLGEPVAEIGVVTSPEFRGRGLAAAAVAHATADLLRSHQGVLYTCEADNHASLAVARRLGAHRLGRMAFVVG